MIWHLVKVIIKKSPRKKKVFYVNINIRNIKDIDIVPISGQFSGDKTL